MGHAPKKKADWMDFAPNEPNLHRPAGSFAKRALRRFRRSETGQALVEFTMVLPIFLLLLFGMIDFGRGFYTWLLVTNAAREGARVAAVQSDNSAINTRIYNSFCDNYPSSCGLNPSKLTINKTNVQGPRGQAVSIDLSYDFDYATPIGNIVALLSGGSLSEPTITAHSSMRLE
jgi:Flp pilus assembly protein TadG